MDKGYVLISKDFTGNITLCRGQHVPGLQFDPPRVDIEQTVGK